jgi:hypothetical protein
MSLFPNSVPSFYRETNIIGSQEGKRDQPHKRHVQFADEMQDDAKESTPTKKFVKNADDVHAPVKSRYLRNISKPVESRQQLAYENDAPPAETKKVEEKVICSSFR